MIVIREGSSGDVPDVGSKKELAGEIRAGRQGRRVRSHGGDMFPEDETTQQVGETGAGSAEHSQREADELAFSLRPGEVSPVIAIENTYYILMVEAKTQSRDQADW
jgi:peptidyl-prolyl cis-trans isomerase SurA